MSTDLFRTGVSATPPKVNPSTPTPQRPANTGGSGVPPSGYEAQLLTWIQLAVREGEAVNAYEGEVENIDENLRIVMGDTRSDKWDEVFDGKPMYRSNYKMSRLGKNINDLASAMTDFRPIGQFKTYNTLYESQAGILDKLMTSWWYNMDIDLKLQLLAKHALTARTAYAHIVFNPMLHSNLGDIDLVVKDFRDILLIRPNSKITIQDALGIVIKSKNTVNWGRARYSDKADKIQANNEGGLSAKWSQKGMVSSPILDYLDRSIPKKKTDFAIPTYDHYEIYIRDGSINSSKQRQWVGPGPEDDNPWGYWVEPGKPLYPRLRLLVVANMNAILFDGGSPYWHQMFPIIKLTPDPWAMSLLGKSALADAMSPHKAYNELYQGLIDCCRKALKPGMIVDRQAVNRQVLDKFDSSEPGFKLRTNPMAGQGIIMEPAPQLPAFVENMMAKTEQHQDHVMGILDMRALSQLKSMGADTDTESLLENLGPSVRTKGRILEVFLRELGQIMRANFFQFYTVERRIEILGQDGMDFEDFDFDPGSLVPAFGPGQFQQSFGANSDKEMARFYSKSDNDDSQSPKSRADRAQEHIKSFTYFIAPNSLLSLAKTQDKLLYLQLFRMGCIDMVTLLEKLDVPNIGEMPGAPRTILERMAAASQQGLVGAVSAAGRKASAQESPQMRPDGKISESG